MIIAAAILLGVGALILTTHQSRVSLPSESSQSAIEPNTAAAEDTAAKVNPTIGNQGNPVDPKQHLTLEEFRVLAQQVSKSLPTKQDLKKISPEDAHLSPSPVLAAGESLGRIAEAVYNEPTLGEEAMVFYLDCANAPMYPDSVRALCYSNYKSLAKKLGRSIEQSTVPASIRQLADKLQGI